MRSFRVNFISAGRFILILGLALFIFPVYVGITGSSAAFAGKLADNLSTDSTDSYAHPALGGPAAAPPQIAPGKGLKREGSGGKKYSAPAKKKEGSGVKKPHGMMGGHGYSKKPEGSASKKGYKKHYGKYDGSKGRHGYSAGHHGYSAGHHGFKGHGSQGHKKDPFSHVLKFADKLGLSDQQIAEIRKNRMAYMKIKIRAEADHQIAHMEMESLIHSGTLDEARMFELGANILESKKQKIHAMVTAKIGILKTLTPEQRKMVSKMHRSHP